MESIVYLILTSMVWVLPAYVANAAPVILGGGRPLDFGKNWSDGKRILGRGKTVKGVIVGLFAGTFVGYLEGVLVLGFLLALGAILGDLIGSFIKRRRGLDQGQPFWILDQFDFIVFALILAALVEIPQWDMLVTILIISPLLHLGTNGLAYKMKVKKVPW